MADDLERSLIADVEGESTDDGHPPVIDVPSFGDGSTDEQLADIDPESQDPKHLSEIDEVDGVSSGALAADSGIEPIGGYREEWRPSGGDSTHFDATEIRATTDPDSVEPISGYREEWRPSGSGDDTFDATDLRAGADVSYGAGASDPYLRVADDIKYADDAAGPLGDGPHEVDIGGNLDEPTEVPIVPADSGADADFAQDFAEAEGGPVAGAPDHLDDVD